MLQPLIILLLLLGLCQADIPNNYTANSNPSLMPKILDFGYSPDQRNLIVLQNQNSGSFFVYDGMRLNNKQQIKITDGAKQKVSPSAFLFSQANDLLIIGSKEGGVYVYKINNGTIDEQYQYSYPIGQKNEQFWVRSISLSKNNTIAIGANTLLIILSIPEAPGPLVEVQRYPFLHRVYSVCWSVLQSNIVFVGAIGQTSGSFSQYNLDEKKPTELNTENTYTIIFLPDGKTLLKGTLQKDIRVYTYEEGQKPVLSTTVTGTQSTKKIIISNNANYIGAQVDDKRVIIWKLGQNTETNLKKNDLKNLRDYLAIFNQTGLNLALTDNANDILILTDFKSTDVSKYSLCSNGTFLDWDKNDCTPCLQNCKTCFNSSVCISCFEDKFISGDICAFCYTKLNGCITCTDENHCLTCNQDQFWNKDSTGGKCTCKPTYYENETGKCALCSDKFTDCELCDFTNNCTKCKDEGNFDPQAHGGKCLCKESYWLNDTQCTLCSQQIGDCLFCTQNGSQCTKCTNPYKKPNENGSKCVCIDYRYENPQGQCQLCDPNQNCIKCDQQYPYNCTKCDTAKNRKQEPYQGKCVCDDSFYDKNGTCDHCDQPIPGCVLCKDNQTCTQCKNTDNFNPQVKGDKCVCIDGWILDGRECQNCTSKITGCKTCSSVDFCTLCDQEQNFNPVQVSGKCHCLPEYWLKVNICEECFKKIPGCKTCQENGQQCLSCSDPNREPSDDGKECVCKPFKYEDENNVCQPCDTKNACVRCNQTVIQHPCIECDSSNGWNKNPDHGVCVCKEGYNEYQGKCIFCSVPGCTECKSQTTCEHCSEQKKFDPNPSGDKCECKNGTHPTPDQSECKYCNQTLIGCIKCSNSQECENCDGEKHFIINEAINKCECNKTYYLKNNESCESCSIPIPNCKLCGPADSTVLCDECNEGFGLTGSKKQCVSCSNISMGCIQCKDLKTCGKCDQAHNFVQNGTACKCNDTFYLDNTECKLCSIPMKGCKLCDNDKKCTTCKTQQNFFLENDECICKQGWTLQGDTCVSCTKITGCLYCLDLNNCTKCNDTGNFEPSTDKKCQCSETFWLNSTYCESCQTITFDCLTCEPKGSKCNSCKDPYRELNQQNTCQCKKYMFDDDQRVCQFCDPKRNCISCKNNYTCIKCDSQKHWLQDADQGKCVCQKDYTQFENSCYLCQIMGCELCQSDNVCSRCSKERNFNVTPSGDKCVCADTYHSEGDGCFKCDYHMPGCVQCSDLQTCSRCDDINHFVLNQQKSICQCIQSFYFNTTLRKCDQCSNVIDNCQICNIHAIDYNANECISCKKGFQPTDDHQSCLSCGELITGCLFCNDSTHCQECNKTGNFVPDGDDSCVCLQGYFQEAKTCLKCDSKIPGCLTCSSHGNQCLTCDWKSNFIPNKETLQCDCVKGYYMNSRNCSLCSGPIPGCTQCSQAGTQCSQCNTQHFIPDNKTKTCMCQEGYFIDKLSSQCVLCSGPIPGCSKCSSDGISCEKCKQAQNFVINKQIKKCDCIEGFYLLGSTCVLCSYNITACAKCSMDGKQCFGCKGDNFVINETSKKCDCKEGYYLNKSLLCDLCSNKMEGCQKCSQDGSKCDKCNSNENLIVDNTSQKCICNIGYFNNSEHKCSLCSTVNPGCSKCSQTGQSCLECSSASFTLNQTSKACQCTDVGSYISSKTSCTYCNSSINYCLSCSSNFKQGKFTAYCTACHFNFDLSSDGLQCLCEGDNKQLTDEGECIFVKKSSSGWIIWVIIGAGALTIAIVAVFIYKWCIKRKRIKLDSYSALSDQGPNKKQQTIISDNSTSQVWTKTSGMQNSEYTLD